MKKAESTDSEGNIDTFPEISPDGKQSPRKQFKKAVIARSVSLPENADYSLPRLPSFLPVLGFKIDMQMRSHKSCRKYSVDSRLSTCQGEPARDTRSRSFGSLSPSKTPLSTLRSQRSLSLCRQPPRTPVKVQFISPSNGRLPSLNFCSVEQESGYCLSNGFALGSHNGCVAECKVVGRKDNLPSRKSRKTKSQ